MKCGMNGLRIEFVFLNICAYLHAHTYIFKFMISLVTYRKPRIIPILS